MPCSLKKHLGSPINSLIDPLIRDFLPVATFIVGEVCCSLQKKKINNIAADYSSSVV